jgi:hypothetical protein
MMRTPEDTEVSRTFSSKMMSGIQLSWERES